MSVKEALRSSVGTSLLMSILSWMCNCTVYKVHMRCAQRPLLLEKDNKAMQERRSQYTPGAPRAIAAMAAAIIQEIWQVVEESRGKKARRLPLLQRPRVRRAGGDTGTPY